MLSDHEPIKKIDEGIFVSPLVVPAPADIKVDKFNRLVDGSMNYGDVLSRILIESQRVGVHVAVSFNWLVEQYARAMGAIQNGQYEFDSPFAKDMIDYKQKTPGKNLKHILEALVHNGLLAETSAGPVVGNDISAAVYLTPKGISRYNRYNIKD